MDGRTDMTKLIVAFRSFANAPKNEKQRMTFMTGRDFKTKQIQTSTYVWAHKKHTSYNTTQYCQTVRVIGLCFAHYPGLPHVPLPTYPRHKLRVSNRKRNISFALFTNFVCTLYICHFVHSCTHCYVFRH